VYGQLSFFTAAMLMFPKDETEALFVSQINFLGVELFLGKNGLIFFSNTFAWLLATCSEIGLSTKNNWLSPFSPIHFANVQEEIVDQLSSTMC